MTNFKEYFRAHLKTNLRSIIYIFAVVLALTFLMGINEQPSTRYDSDIRKYITYYSPTLHIPVIFLCVLAYVLPVMEFSFFKKRINLDCAYALPISRKAMGTVHYLTGLIILFGAFTSSYLLNFVILLGRGPGLFHLTPMLAHYFLCLLLGFALYALMTFIFNEANTKGDGIWFMVLYTFALILFCGALALVAKLDLVLPECAIPWITITTVTSYYQDVVANLPSSAFVYVSSTEFIPWIVFWTAVGIASAIDFFRTFGKRRTEKTEEISDSPFGFRTLIPIFAICGMIVFQGISIVLLVIIELFAILGYTIYRRGFQYKKSDIIWLCLFLIFLFIEI